jgi:hypothetical protein
VGSGMSASSGAGCPTRTPHGSSWRSFAATIPRFPARGQAVCAGGERCYDRQDLWAAPSTWLGARAGLGRGPRAQSLIFSKS